MGCSPSKERVDVQDCKGSHISNGSGKDHDAEHGVYVGSYYKMVKEVGCGAVGVTWHCRDVRSGQDVAVKLIQRPLPAAHATPILQELSIQAQLGWGHVNLIPPYEVLLTPSHLCLVMELAAGGTLLALLEERCPEEAAQGQAPFTEEEALYIFRQILSAVKFCHAHCVAHRDLKLENTLLDGGDPPVVKLCDFGTAKSWDATGQMFTHVGTYAYMSPELLQSLNNKLGYDGKSVDVWASGVLLLLLLTGSFLTDYMDPGVDEAQRREYVEALYTRIKQAPHLVESIQKLSPECRELLRRLLDPDQKKRISVEEIERHPWYCKPLQPRYQQVLDQLASKQRELDAVREKVQMSEAEAVQQGKQLAALVQEATTLPLGPCGIKSINLRRPGG